MSLKTAALFVGPCFLFAAACGSMPAENVSQSEAALAADVHDVWTQHYDNGRSGATLVETTLNTSNVNVSTFGKLFTRSVDDQIYAQPLYLAGVPIAGGTHNVVYVATVNDTLYAFDADDPAASTPLATRSLLDVAASGARAVKNADVGQSCGTYLDFAGNLGIVGTPVIDVASATLYVVSRVKEPAGFVQRLHALDLTTFADRPGSPVVITASMPGTGAGSVNGTLSFNAQTQNQRAALLLSNGVVYITWASQCDTDPYHGWILGYDASTLAQRFVFNDTPDGSEGGIWQAGQGLAADDTGKVYALTGNGTSNARAGGQSYGMAFLKLDPQLASPVVDWFTPFNVDDLNAADSDLGASGVLLIPGTHLVLGGGKEGKLYLVNRDDMGHFQSGSDSQIVQSFQATLGHIHGSPVYWNSQTAGQQVYVWSENDFLKAFSFSGSGFNTVPVTSTMKVPDGMPGGIMSVSANGSTPGSGIVWVGHPSSGDANHATQPGILRAMDAENVSHELWNSNMNVARDGLGNFAKYVSPVVANGKVYLATFSYQLVVYGLLPTSSLPTPSNGTGLLGEYFDNIDLTGAEVSRLDPSVSFDWGTGSPDPTIGPDTFSARWSGQVLPQFSEPYTFTVRTDDGARLWINGALIVDDWNDHGAQDDTATVSLVAGEKYDLKMEYFEDGQSASAQLFWQSPSLAKQIIPASQLFPAAGGSTGSDAGAGGASGAAGGASGGASAGTGGASTGGGTSAGGAAGSASGGTGAGTGLQAQYFDNLDFTGTLITRTDANVNFDWGTGSPDPAIGPDTFSARWTGQIMPRYSESYTFSTASDDGVRLWVNGVLIIDNWNDHGRWIDAGTISLAAGQKYDLKLEYYEDGGDAVMQLSWFSASQALEIVPQSQLFPPSSETAGTGLSGSYFDNMDLTTLRLTRTDPTISFDWGLGSPDPSIDPDTFSVRWTGQVLPRYSETYTFSTTSDDGVRLWVNGLLIIDNWTDHGAWTDRGMVTLTAGQKASIKLEFYEHSVNAAVSLGWSSASQATEVIPQSQLFPQ